MNAWGEQSSLPLEVSLRPSRDLGDARRARVPGRYCEGWEWLFLTWPAIVLAAAQRPRPGNSGSPGVRTNRQP